MFPFRGLISNQGLTNSPQERRTLLLHLTYTIINYFFLGVFLLKENILTIALSGSTKQVTALFMCTVFIFVVSSPLNEILRRSHNRKKLLRIIAIVTRCPFLIFLFFPEFSYEESSYWGNIYVLLFMVYFIGNSIIMPNLNLLIKLNYAPDNFQKFYLWNTTIGIFLMILGTYAIGILQEANGYHYRYVYTVFALFGTLSVFTLTKINFRDKPHRNNWSLSKVFVISYIRMVKILRKNRAFAHFELSYMLYGFAYMGTFSLIKVYYDEVLHLNYSTLSINENIANIIKILIVPLLGVLLERIDPRRFGIIPFSALFFMLLFVLLAEYYPLWVDLSGDPVSLMLVLAMVCFGVFFGTNTLLWNIGSSYFCHSEQVADYQATHMTLAGLRGIVVPWVGYLLFHAINYSGVFIIGMCSLVGAVMVLRYSSKHVATKNN